MSRSMPYRFVSIALAVAAPAAILHMTAGDRLLAADRTAPPFAWPRLLLAHLVFSLPLGLMIASWLGPSWALAGLPIVLAVAWIGPAIVAGLDASTAGFVARGLVRSTIAVLLAWPWLMPAARGLPDPGGLAAVAVAYDGLAEAERASGRPEAAERLYREARGRLPDRAAHFAAALGHHYQMGGRPAAALDQFREALRIDPADAEGVAESARRVRASTPACLIPTPPRSIPR